MIQVADIIADAKAATSLSNFGADGWQEGLEILTDSVNREADLNDMGRASFTGQCTMFLIRRLEIEYWYSRHPEIDEQQIVAPLMVLGLPRTGSTYLHSILGEDPNVRVMRNWECMFPTPPPEAATYWSDPRIAMMDENMKMRDQLTPRMKQMLPSTSTSPTEDQMTMGYDFKSQMFQSMFRIPAYTDWFNHKADLVPTMHYVKRVLKLLQWRCPPTRWRLKNPTYALLIDALDLVFPDARYVMTHRDVASVIPSVADLYFELSRNNTDKPDKLWMGAVMRETCALGMQRMIEFRAAGNEHRFFDIHFAPLQVDPFPALEQLYIFLGEEFTEDAKVRMTQWRSDQPRGKHGNHEYEPADYGLDRDELRDFYRFYSDQFGVPAAGQG
jgi:Sulfotransferase family